jgi:deoxyribodipyrimidine photo-lyase
MLFETAYPAILEKINQADPVAYARSRNFIDGAVTYLSPYISRGVISTKQVLQNIMGRGYKLYQIEKFIQELAWREYFQRVGQAKPNLYNTDIKQPQFKVANTSVPTALLDAATGIHGIDTAITQLYQTGYMHNHCRMYVACLACNIAQCHWYTPSRWMYYHLLDADFASNACSWQWVAGTFSHKKYYADQMNINRYCHTAQQGTFLDVPYAALETMDIPSQLAETSLPNLTTTLPQTKPVQLDVTKPTLLYNSYNIDPLWRKDEDVNRVLLLEPSHFNNHPVSAHTINFIVQLAENIEGMQLFIGEFSALQSQYPGTAFMFKEHPLFSHYKEVEDARDWMFPEVTGFYQSFFSYWKACEKYVHHYTP